MVSRRDDSPEFAPRADNRIHRKIESQLRDTCRSHCSVDDVQNPAPLPGSAKALDREVPCNYIPVLEGTNTPFRFRLQPAGARVGALHEQAERAHMHRLASQDAVLRGHIVPAVNRTSAHIEFDLQAAKLPPREDPLAIKHAWAMRTALVACAAQAARRPAVPGKLVAAQTLKAGSENLDLERYLAAKCSRTKLPTPPQVRKEMWVAG